VIAKRDRCAFGGANAGDRAAFSIRVHQRLNAVHRSFQQRNEPRLLQVVVGGESFCSIVAKRIRVPISRYRLRCAF